MNDQQVNDKTIDPPRSLRTGPIEPYGWHRDVALRKEKAVNDIKDVWRNHKSGAVPHKDARQKISKHLLWGITNTECLFVGSTSSNSDFRFMTEAAYDACDPAVKNSVKDLQHEHVYQKKRMAIEILKCETESEVEKVLLGAVACIVTKTEHKALAEFDHLYGWARYHEAGLKVIERQRTELPGPRTRK